MSLALVLIIVLKIIFPMYFKAIGLFNMLYLKKNALAASLAVLCLSGVASALTGKVVDSYSNPVKGALVRLREAGLSDSTKSDGGFSFSTTQAAPGKTASGPHLQGMIAGRITHVPGSCQALIRYS
jgi:hypothetical protein